MSFSPNLSQGNPLDDTRTLLGHGNSKLGRSIHTFSLPAVQTCPGSTPVCRQECYALTHFFRTPSVREALLRSYRATQSPDFRARMVREIRRRQVTTLRVHVSGDLYSVPYARDWLEIIRACRKVRFFLFTRSWRVEGFRPVLGQLARERNCRLWFSLDRDSGRPGAVPSRVRLAYMAVGDEDNPQTAAGQPAAADLIFRCRHRSKQQRNRQGQLVCPKENGTPAGHALTCERCRLCLGPLAGDDPVEGPTTVRDPRRYSLPLRSGRLPG